MKGIAVIMLLICLAPLGTAQVAQDCTYYGPYVDCGRPSGFVAMQVPSFVDGTYNPWPYYMSVPAKCEVQAARHRLWANMYFNPNSAWWQVQAAKERLYTRTSACPDCRQEIEESEASIQSMQWERYSRSVEAGESLQEMGGCPDCDEGSKDPFSGSFPWS